VAQGHSPSKPAATRQQELSLPLAAPHVEFTDGVEDRSGRRGNGENVGEEILGANVSGGGGRLARLPVASSPASTPRRTGKRAVVRLPVASSPARRGGAGSSLPPGSSWPRSAPRGRILAVPATAALSPLPPFSLTPQILAGAVGAVLLFFGLIAACCCCYCWGPAVSRASTSSRPRSTPSAASTTNTSLSSSAPTSTARAGARLRVRPQLHP
jgi:hypothetical protein